MYPPSSRSGVRTAVNIRPRTVIRSTLGTVNCLIVPLRPTIISLRIDDRLNCPFNALWITSGRSVSKRGQPNVSAETIIECSVPRNVGYLASGFCSAGVLRPSNGYLAIRNFRRNPQFLIQVANHVQIKASLSREDFGYVRSGTDVLPKEVPSQYLF